MRPLTLIVSLFVVLAGLTGCVSPQPDYPVSVMTFDEGLVGPWSVKGADAAAPTLRIEACDVPVSNGRLVTEAFVVTGHTQGHEEEPILKTKAYRMVQVGPDGKEICAMFAFLVSTRPGETLLGVQL